MLSEFGFLILVFVIVKVIVMFDYRLVLKMKTTFTSPYFVNPFH